jgi:hypothetical protein
MPLPNVTPPAKKSGRLAAAAAAVVAAVLLAGGLALFGDPDTDATSEHRVAIVIAGEALSIPANRIRFVDQRRGGDLPRVDLATLWPGLTGRTDANRATFDDPAGADAIVHVAIEPRELATDSAGRLATVYLRFLAPDDAAPPPEPVAGLVARRFAAGSPYEGATLYFEPGAVRPFVAHCFPRAEGDPRRVCLTEINFGGRLVAAFRFRPALLADWPRLGDAFRAFLTDLAPTPPAHPAEPEKAAPPG